MGMPMPCAPRSPSPRIRDPSVTTMMWTSSWGQFQTMDEKRPRSWTEKYMPRARRNWAPKFSQTAPTVGV